MNNTVYLHPCDTLVPQRWAGTRHMNQAARPRWFDMAAAASLAHRYANGFVGRAYTVPNAPNVDVAANGTFEGRLTLPDGSYIWCIQGESTQAAGFEFAVKDYTTGEELWNKRVKNAVGAGTATAMGILSRPHLVISPGILLVQILNKAAVQNNLQLAFLVLVPANAR